MGNAGAKVAWILGLCLVLAGYYLAPILSQLCLPRGSILGRGSGGLDLHSNILSLL